MKSNCDDATEDNLQNYLHSNRYAMINNFCEEHHKQPHPAMHGHAPAKLTLGILTMVNLTRENTLPRELSAFISMYF